MNTGTTSPSNEVSSIIRMRMLVVDWPTIKSKQTINRTVLYNKKLVLVVDREVLFRLLLPKEICVLYPLGMNQKLFFFQCPLGLPSSNTVRNYMCHIGLKFI